MTMRLLLEEECGSSTGRRHPHNGYYAGDFFSPTGTPERSTHSGPAELPLRLLPGTGVLTTIAR